MSKRSRKDQPGFCETEANPLKKEREGERERREAAASQRRSLTLTVCIKM